MKIQQKLSISTSVIFGVVFLVSSGIIYYVFTTTAERLYYNAFAQTADLAAVFYLEKDEISNKDHLRAEKEFMAAIGSQVIRIFNAEDHVEYGTRKKDENLNARILDHIRKNRELDFKRDETYYHGRAYSDNQGEFVIVVSERKVNFTTQKRNLLFILGGTFLTGFIIIVLLSRLLSQLAYKPVRNIIDQVNEVNLDHTHELSYPHTRDELEDLFAAFNKMLRKLHSNFQIQKNFISHASHELKTPLAAIIGDLEVAMQSKRSESDYIELITNVLSDANRLHSIIQNLVVLAGLNQSQKQVERIDEILWEAIETIGEKHPNVKVQVEWNLDTENHNILEIHGNKTQLYMALYNLVENAVKFSLPHPVTVSLTNPAGNLEITIADQGPGISTEELEFITSPFFRGKNASLSEGHGLGLTIAAQILDHHGVQWEINSLRGKGTKVRLRFSPDKR